MARKAASVSVGKRGKARHRKASRGAQPYAWLGAGALTLGVGAALAGGTAVAHADAGDSADTAGRASTPARESSSRTAGKTQSDTPPNNRGTGRVRSSAAVAPGLRTSVGLPAAGVKVTAPSRAVLPASAGLSSPDTLWGFQIVADLVGIGAF